MTEPGGEKYLVASVDHRLRRGGKEQLLAQEGGGSRPLGLEEVT